MLLYIVGMHFQTCHLLLSDNPVLVIFNKTHKRPDSYYASRWNNNLINKYHEHILSSLFNKPITVTCLVTVKLSQPKTQSIQFVEKVINRYICHHWTKSVSHLNRTSCSAGEYKMISVCMFTRPTFCAGETIKTKIKELIKHFNKWAVVVKYETTQRTLDEIKLKELKWRQLRKKSPSSRFEIHLRGSLYFHSVQSLSSNQLEL